MKKSVFVFVMLFAATAVCAPSPEVCATNSAELVSTPALVAALKPFGGPSQLFAKWKLAGFASIIAHVQVDMRANASGLVVRVNDDEPNMFWLCVSEDQPDILKMRVQAARQPENSLILLKARDSDDTVSVANKKSGWKFMKFKRAD